MGSGTNNLDAVSAALVTAGVGQITARATDWFIEQGYMSDGVPGVDRAIAIYETPGEAPLEAWLIDYPGFQVVIRGSENDYAVVRQKMQDAFEALHANEAPITVTSPTSFVYFYGRQSAPISMGRDELKRPKMAWNFRSMRNRPE